MKPACALTAMLAALLATGAALPAAASPLAIVANDTGDEWVLLTDLGHQIPGVLAATRSPRAGAEGSGTTRRTRPDRRETLGMVLDAGDAVLVQLERPVGKQPMVMLHLLMPRRNYQFHVEYRLDTRTVPARATLVPVDDLFCPLDQDPYRLQVSADGGTVRIRRRSQGAAGEEAKADGRAGAEAKAAGADLAGLEEPAGGIGSPACAIL